MKILSRILAMGLGYAVLTGCSGPATGVVRGTVAIDGESITFGTVAFIGKDGRVDQAMIKADGTYEVTQAPVGEVVITVQTYPLPPQVQPPDQPVAKGKGSAQLGGARYVPVPPKYADAKQSPLRHTVQAGEQTHDLALTKKP